MQTYARVITDDPTDKELDYSIPESWVGKVHIGSRVKVPLRSREILATVVALVDTPSVPEPKIISALISESPILNKSLLALARWMAEYYCCPVESAIRSVLPQVIRKAKLGFKRERIVSVNNEISEDGSQKHSERKLLVKRKCCSSSIEVAEPIRWRELQQRAATTDRTIQHLVDRGLLRVELETADRDPYANETVCSEHRSRTESRSKKSAGNGRSVQWKPETTDRSSSMASPAAAKQKFICRRSIIA